ncbi:MAG TPA: CHAT domain-containing protein, partial [Polyangiaceae bacterium]
RFFVHDVSTRPVEVTLNGQPAQLPPPTAFSDGRLFRIGDATPGSLLIRTGGSEWRATVATSPPQPEAIRKAAALWRSGKLDEAAALLEREDVDGGGATAVLAARARLENARGHDDAAAVMFRELMARRAQEGRRSEAADDAFTLAFLLLRHRRFSEAREALARAAELARDYPDGQARLTYYEGVLASDTGDLRGALRKARAAEARAARLGADSLRSMALQAVAAALVELGRREEALETVRVALRPGGPSLSDCDRADLLTNLGWWALVGADRGHPLAPNDRAAIDDALALYRRSCPNRERIANALLNLAQARLDEGAAREAQEALDEAKRAAPDPSLDALLPRLHVEGRIALAARAPSRALSVFERESDTAAGLPALDDRRVAAEDRATALLALGRKGEALAVLEELGAALDRGGVDVPLGEGKDGFFGVRENGDALRVKLLVDAGRAAEAMRVARHARARLVASVRPAEALETLDDAGRAKWEAAIGAYRQAKDALDDEAAHDWELSADRLVAAREARRMKAAHVRALLDDALAVLPASLRLAPPPDVRPGEVVLLYFPTPDGGWLGFSETVAGVRAVALGAIDPAASPASLGKEMLAPFAEALEHADRVRALMYGALRAVDLHALPFDGGVLVDHAVVEYPLDLGDLGDLSASVPAEAPAALVVSDPAGDLPSARVEADAVSAALRGAAWPVESLRGASASADAIARQLAHATLFHYAGHARYGGPDGLESALPLAAGGSLAPGDVLALGHVPEAVALFGCETGKESTQGAGETLGIAHAFLAAGARWVVGSARVADDSLSRDVATEFYAALLRTTPIDPARALQGAQRAVRAREPGVDWAAFRALTR